MKRLIAIDTEYNSNEDSGTINRVYCIAACDESCIKLFAELWTDDINEQRAIISQYERQQSRNEKYLLQYLQA